MNSKLFVLLILMATVISFAVVQFLIVFPSTTDLLSQDEIKKTKLDIKSLFNIYGYEENYKIKNGKKIQNDPKFELNPENDEIYQDLIYTSNESTVLVYPIFTASAYNEPGFYSFFRNECDKTCLTVTIADDYSLDFTASGNGYQVFQLLGYPIISDIDVDQNPDVLEKYDKVILLHNEYVTKKEFDAIISHPKVIYLYPNALYAEIQVDYQNNTITLLRGHNFPEPHIRNGFDWKYSVAPGDVTQSLIGEFGTKIVNAPSVPMILICEDQSYRFLKGGLKQASDLEQALEQGCGA